MPTNNPRSAAIPPASPRSTSKYTNKDGSKFITVPKGTSSDSSPPSTPTASTADASGFPDNSAADPSDRPVNRKKQKRRQKAAAKAAAAEQNVNGHVAPAASQLRAGAYGDDEIDASDDDDEPDFTSAAHGAESLANGQSTAKSKSKKNKKKKKKTTSASAEATPESAAIEPSPIPRGPGMSKDKIWSTSNHEERERIKAFWLGLGEDERKSLVKVEKDAVLKKMKEQQKHTCSCTVCGRKRTAIEEELEGLYDAYYLELEQFANQGEGPPLLPPPPRDFPPLRQPRGLPAGYAGQPPSRGRIVEHIGDDDDEEDIEEVYSEDEVDDDEYSDDEPPEAFHSSHERDVADFLTFGNSLQVKGTQLLDSLLHRYGNMDLGGILTVADDLLKNDGKRFIEMMEQLAERRMAREEDAREHFSRGYGHPNGSYSTPHNHPPPPPDDDDYDDEEDEEDDYEDSQDEEYEDEEVYSNPSVMPSAYHTECCCQDQMTEEQRMEEGRRMFQIFAARMFEQRVLSAYKEKVAKERQQKLLEELEEESRQVDEQKAKKAKNAQKKKDKAAQKKQALAEEKARKEAEKAAEESARVEAEQKRVAEQRQKAEEKRRQKEAQRKAEEDARLKKEADRLRRIHEQKEKQAEQERKAREAKEREKKLKDEQRLREKELRDQKEREAQERKDKQERDKREKEARAAKALKEAQEATEAKAKAKEEKAAAAAVAANVTAQKIGIPQASKRTSQPNVPPVLPQHPSNPASYVSPKIPVATPALPKAPTPVRSRAASQQYDAVRTNSVTSQSAASPSPILGTPTHTSPGNIGQERKASFSTSTSMPLGSHPAPPPGFQGSAFHIPPSGMQSPPGLPHHPPPGFQNRMSQDPIYPLGFRPNPNMMMSPPGIGAPGGRGFPPPSGMAPPGFASVGDQFGSGQGFPGIQKETQLPTHTRQSSASYDSTPSSAIPIGRPAPIGRPSATGLGTSHDEDSEPKHLGSSALVGDDEPLGRDINPTGSIRGHPPGLRSTFGTSPFMDSGFSMGHNPWAPAPASTQAFPPPGFSNPGWGAPSMPPGFSVGSPVGGISSALRSAQPRHVTLRQLLCQACKDLTHSVSSTVDGFISVNAIKSQVEAKSGDPTVTEQDLLNLCDTEGSSSNGGGTFDIRRDVEGPGKHAVRWVPDANDGMNPQYRAVGAPGEIGSPRTGYTSMRGI